MKRDKLVALLSSGVLGFVLSCCSVMCLATGFSLTVDQLPRLFLLCGLTALGCAVLFQWRRGTLVFLLASAFLCGYLWRQEIPDRQLLYLIQHLSQVYNNAYHWGALVFTDLPQSADYPLMLLGYLIAAAASRSICTGRGTWLAVATAVFPPALCLVVTDTVPQPLFLFGLMAGIAILILTDSVRRQSVPQANRLTAMVAAPVLLALTILFFLVSPESYENRSSRLREQILAWSQEIPAQLEATLTQLSETVTSEAPASVNLAGLGDRRPSSLSVMTVTADSSTALYLRGQDYDEYTGTGWISTKQRAESFTLPDTVTGTVSIHTRTAQELRYIPYYAAEEIALVGGAARNSEDTQDYRYTVGSLSPMQAAASSGKYGVLPEAQRYLTLPEQTKAAALGLLETVIPENGSHSEKASAIAAFTRNCAEYDLSPSRMPKEAGDFALWFLQEADRGYCVHFATAAVVLLRAADIPARYVTGYMVRTSAGTAVTVTERESHAWAEYYEPQLDAWLILEATPADLDTAGTSPTAPQETEPAATVQTTPQPTASETTPTAASQPPSTDAATQPPEAPEPPAADLTALKQLAQTLLSVGIVLLLLAGQRSTRIALRRRRQSSGTPNARALECWREAELLSRLLKEAPTEELLCLAQKARFSQHQLSAEELAQFDGYLRTCRQQLKRKPLYIRLIHQFIFAAY